MSFKIIALAGAAGSGKDTAADYLCKQYDFARYAFAKPLKAALCAMFGWTGFELELRKFKEEVLPDIGKSPRQMLQTLGTEWGRQLVNPHLWLLLAQREIDRARQCGEPGIVITDCRFENEAVFVLAQGGKVLHIVRPGVEAVASHVSETRLPSHVVSAQFVNDGTPDELGEQICDYANEWSDYSTL